MLSLESTRWVVFCVGYVFNFLDNLSSCKTGNIYPADANRSRKQPLVFFHPTQVTPLPLYKRHLLLWPIYNTTGDPARGVIQRLLQNIVEHGNVVPAFVAAPSSSSPPVMCFAVGYEIFYLSSFIYCSTTTGNILLMMQVDAENCHLRFFQPTQNVTPPIETPPIYYCCGG